MMEEVGLTSVEQGGFRRGGGCGDQVLTLMLLRQVKACTRRGIFATFVDFRKAYDRVDKDKLWQCLQASGFGGRAQPFKDSVQKPDKLGQTWQDAE